MSELIEGVCVQVRGNDVQAAIEEAGKLYRKRFDRTPTHISLPAWVEPGSVKLYGLHAGRPTCRSTVHTKYATVIVGRLTGSGHELQQLRMVW